MIYTTTNRRGKVFIRDGVIYVLWRGQERSAEAWEADSMDNDCSMNDLEQIINAIEMLRTELEGAAQ